MRVVFAGSPEIAVPSLSRLAQEHTVCGVLTNPDRVAGRGRRVTETPVKQAALEIGLDILQPERLEKETRETIASLRSDILVVVAYGRIFGPKFLGLFPRGGVNLHPSLLPALRGPTPIPAAILAGLSQTGITAQRLAIEMDSGNILAQETIPLSGDETTGSLTEKASQIGAQLLSKALADVEAGSAEEVVQDHGAATYCSLIEKTDGRIDWRNPAVEIERMVRAYDPWPRAFTEFHDSRLSILRAQAIESPIEQPEAAPGTVIGVDKSRGILIQTGKHILAAEELQLQARKALDWRSFANGVKDFVGATLGGQ